MADETTTTWEDLLREAKGPLVEGLRWSTVMLAEIKRDKNPRRWSGKQVTVPIIEAPQQGASMITQTATLTSPEALDTEQAIIQSAIIEIAISFSTQVIEAAKQDETSWAQVVPTKMRMAEEAISRVLNEQMLGAGNALLAAFTATATNATQTVGTAANFYQLYANRVVDLKVIATGADVASANGAGRKIVDFSASAGTVTFDASVNVTTTVDGIFIQGSYGNALQGVGQAVATTGTFQGLAKGSVPVWRGTDVTPAANVDPTMARMDKADRAARQNSGSVPELYLFDPAVLDKYQQLLSSQARWSGAEKKLQSGFTGVEYRGRVLLDDFDMPNETAFGIAKEDCTIYTLDDGPDWDEKTGALFQRFARKLPVEAWLVWMLQLGFHRCNSFVKHAKLNRAD